MKLSNTNFFALGLILALGQAVSFAAEKPLSCNQVLLESSLDATEAKQFSIKELVINDQAAYAKLKFRGVRGHRDMTCEPSITTEVNDGFRLDGTCMDRAVNGYKMDVKSSIEGEVTKETFVFIRLKSNNRLVSRLSCDRPLLRRLLNR